MKLGKQMWREYEEKNKPKQTKTTTHTKKKNKIKGNLNSRYLAALYLGEYSSRGFHGRTDQHPFLRNTQEKKTISPLLLAPRLYADPKKTRVLCIILY